MCGSKSSRVESWSFISMQHVQRSVKELQLKRTHLAFKQIELVREDSIAFIRIILSAYGPLERVFACFDCSLRLIQTETSFLNTRYTKFVFHQLVNLIASCMIECGRMPPYMEIDQFLEMERQHFEKLLFIILFWFSFD